MTEPDTTTDPVTAALTEIANLLLRQHNLLNDADQARRLGRVHTIATVIGELRQVRDELAAQTVIVATAHHARRADPAGQDHTDHHPPT